ncbi:Gibberellin 2-beta-dioxygenase 2 [Sesamum alatum]|uniref:gibberellin 2beta-dioxygenase n=1 Tax=Sesamum alatum TaxID=300844 RepID=A0AAE2CKZ5_9LAMI|nr:Gibberellin 2-beta-dioxygenase 2 [Sesamum alatum]
MVIVAAANANANANVLKMEKIRDDIQLPIIDLLSSKSNRSQVSKQIVKACEEYGFFKVINHGVPQEIITQMEEEAHNFFSKPGSEKERAGPANPYGYGCKNIGLKGDMGEVEYLLLQTNSPFINSKYYISQDPNKFRCRVNGYVEAVRELACEVLDLIGEGLGLGLGFLSELIRDVQSDSVLRLNHYPACCDVIDKSASKIGFGEHTDPQILTLLRSNGVEGLQISLEEGVWVPVNPHPDSGFCVNVGDVLKVMTNERFVSVKHRVVVNSYKARTSIAYFAAPPLHATITNCLPDKDKGNPIYTSFTWGDYKKATYTCRLGDTRLNHFKFHNNN